ncbi:MAG TPA: hypothetical protein VGY66_18675 [Gemmataceae bacterium]|nr:hypothetical protein [Gemmataceae bacterium]
MADKRVPVTRTSWHKVSSVTPQHSFSMSRIATLNLAVAGLGVIISLWLGAMLMQFAHSQVSAVGLLGGPDPMALFDILRDRTFRVYVICSSGLRLLFALCLVIAALGLFQHRAWGRSLTLTYAWTRIGTALLEWAWLLFLFESGHFLGLLGLGRLTSWGIDLEVWGERCASLWFLIVMIYPIAIILVMRTPGPQSKGQPANPVPAI